MSNRHFPHRIRYETLVQGNTSVWMKGVLRTVARLSLPPTVASRLYFLCASTMMESLRILIPSMSSVDKYVDMPPFPFTIDAVESDVWVEMSTYDALYEILLSMRLSTVELDATLSIQRRLYRRIHDMLRKNPSFPIRTAWRERVRAYIVLRSRDGSMTASTFQPSDAYPNAALFIVTDPSQASTQDLTTVLRQPDEWCALEIGSRRQTYLTPQWGDVEGLLSPTDAKQLADVIGQTFFPDEETHRQEVLDLLAMVENLTPQQKMSAEFWAGGSNTVTPPGFWMYFAICCVQLKNVGRKEEIQLLYRMSASLFQVGILAWRLKRTYLQRRPIQAIRQLRPERMVKMFDGTEVSNMVWLPYQTSNFVTPPFPDFVSGHSSFSSIGARVLTDFFGTNIIPTTERLSSNEMYLLSPVLSLTDPTCDLCSLVVYPKQSQIQMSFPPTGVNLRWSTWEDMAVDAGQSRLFGGIHYESSNQAGQALGRRLYDVMWKS